MPYTKTVRECVFEIFDQFGIDKVFGNPGSTELPMFRNFPEHFEYVLGLQESIVIGMADGYAQARRRPAVVNLHSAVGVGHALGNIFTAYKNQTPLLVTAGQQARSILPYQPFLGAEQAAEFPKPYVKWSCEPARAEDVPAAIATALRMAVQPPMGPVFVSIPVDDWDRPGEAAHARSVTTRMRADPDAVARIAAALARSKKPCFISGAGVALDDAWDEFVTFAERNNAPVWVAPMTARNSFPENHDLFQGFLPAQRQAIVERLQGHDLILVMGAPLFTYHVEGGGPHIPDDAEAFQITNNPQHAACAAAGKAICANVKLVLQDLLDRLEPARRPAPPKREETALASGEPLTDVYLFQRMAALRDPKSIIVEEAPSSRLAMQANLPVTVKNGFYTCASGGLGHALPASLGVAMGRPEEKVIALLGDGSSMYAIQGLWSAAQHKLPISFIIVNNGRYEALERFGRHFSMQKVEGTKLSDIDFVGLAESQGVSAWRALHKDELDDALLRSFAAKEPTLVEVVVE
ncbi:benzoylformate decarboxylase [Hyphococcus luteus]|uniref:Benzoylformate decarboxylase n=1 Tax=Hyphococcus luteus TaxID=2058213 RepID=A0A2S7K1L9_9PROT|nr:benzoylformate decarboxylase [Marinicaulis flavus]PQA86393.1 benzoylformate decarboxylase [Marinicaulis flavus]